LHASGNDEALAAFEERKMLALLIVSAAEPLQHVPAIMRVTKGEPEPPALARRKVAVFRGGQRHDYDVLVIASNPVSSCRNCVVSSAW